MLYATINYCGKKFEPTGLILLTPDRTINGKSGGPDTGPEIYVNECLLDYCTPENIRHPVGSSTKNV